MWHLGRAFTFHWNAQVTSPGPGRCIVIKSIITGPVQFTQCLAGQRSFTIICQWCVDDLRYAIPAQDRRSFAVPRYSRQDRWKD